MAKKEYIEREALLDYIDKRIPKLIASSDGKHIVYIETIREVIVKFPTADVVEVVRCKDCIYRGREDCAMFYRCDCGEQHTWETDNDFCSYGERKDG